jgi:hypothetical protein
VVSAPTDALEPQATGNDYRDIAVGRSLAVANGPIIVIAPAVSSTACGDAAGVIFTSSDARELQAARNA